MPSGHNNNGMVMNPEKFKFGVSEMDFAGFWVGNSIIKPMESHFDAIRNFKEPRNITDFHSFIALCEQVAYSTKEDLILLRELLKQDGMQFYWDSQLSIEFQKIR